MKMDMPQQRFGQYLQKEDSISWDRGVNKNFSFPYTTCTFSWNEPVEDRY